MRKKEKMRNSSRIRILHPMIIHCRAHQPTVSRRSRAVSYLWLTKICCHLFYGLELGGYWLFKTILTLQYCCWLVMVMMSAARWYFLLMKQKYAKMNWKARNESIGNENVIVTWCGLRMKKELAIIRQPPVKYVKRGLIGGIMEWDEGRAWILD